jgi:hypothetical protein
VCAGNAGHGRDPVDPCLAVCQVPARLGAYKYRARSNVQSEACPICVRAFDPVDRAPGLPAITADMWHVAVASVRIGQCQVEMGLGIACQVERVPAARVDRRVFGMDVQCEGVWAIATAAIEAASPDRPIKTNGFICTDWSELKGSGTFRPGRYGCHTACGQHKSAKAAEDPQ